MNYNILVYGTALKRVDLPSTRLTAKGLLQNTALEQPLLFHTARTEKAVPTLPLRPPFS